MPEIRSSVCALDCPDACSLLVHIGDDGRATKLRGNPEHPITRGFLCAKVAKYLDREYHPQRLLYPQRRTGAKGEGRFERISWDEALDSRGASDPHHRRASARRRFCPTATPARMGLLNGTGMDRRFFHRLGASRLDRTICSSAGGEALTQTLGIRYGTEPEQFRTRKLIIAWGANILGTNVHLWPFIVEARRNGAQVVCHRSAIATAPGAAADKHFAINPGSDLALALGMMHVIMRRRLHDREYVDQLHQRLRRICATRVASRRRSASPQLTGIAAEEIVNLAREYATTRPAAIRVNYGVQRSERGGHGRAGDRAAAGADGIVARNRRRPAAFHIAGVSVQPGGAGNARIAAAFAAGARGAHREYVASWARR